MKSIRITNWAAKGSAAALLLALVIVPAIAPTPARAEPRSKEENPAYGDVLDTLPEFFHLCFSEPVKVEGSDNWKFDVVTPEGTSLGLRIVFTPAGDCVDVYPGAPDEPPQGIWTFDWMVRAQADDSEGTGVIKFQLGELQPGETPLDRGDAGDTGSLDASDDGSSPILLVAIGVGVALILVAGGGFALSRRGARQR